MQVAIRTDASFQIGSGHVMRCLTLAERLRETGAEVLFVCRELAGNLNEYISAKGFELYRLPSPAGQSLALNWNPHASWLEVPLEQDAGETAECLKKNIRRTDWLIIDHYALDANWERRLRPLADQIMVIDDLADRLHACEILLDQNLYKYYETRYDSLVPKSCLKFLGPQYALLRKEFITARKELRQRDGRVRRILIFFGGVDFPNLTEKMLDIIKSIDNLRIRFDIVTGGGNPFREEIEYRCSLLSNTFYYSQVNNMAELMNVADLAIGGGGSTVWERCFLGLPSVVVMMADNQRETVEILSQLGALYSIGSYKNFRQEHLKQIIKKIISFPIVLSEMSASSFEIMKYFKGLDGLITSMQERQHV